MKVSIGAIFEIRNERLLLLHMCFVPVTSPTIPVKMSRLFYCKKLFGYLKNDCSLLKRLFLSDAFKCTEAWESRLRTPIFQKVQYGNLYSELDKCFTSGQRINVLDVDIFANGIVDDSYQNELEDILQKVRANPETSLVYESTSHAVIRLFLSWNKKDDLLNILCQRMVYGVFPDPYLCILMMDTFLKQNDVLSAVKIAVLQMLQEDCNHPIMKGLSLYSCVKYLNSSDVWATPTEENNEDEEVVKVRVDFVRNEYYDDHFDIVDTNHLVGKTMCSFGKTIEGPIGISCQLIGLLLHEKFDEAEVFVSKVIQNNLPLYKETIEKVKSYIQKKPKQLVEGENKEGEKVNENKASAGINEETPNKVKSLKLLDALDTLNIKNLLPDPLETVLEDFTREEVKENEENYIGKQCELYKKWEVERMKLIEEEMTEQNKMTVMREIEELKQQLEEEERKIFCYDHELEYDELVEEKRKKIQSVQYYIPKHKKKVIAHEAYVPPKVSGRTT